MRSDKLLELRLGLLLEKIVEFDGEPYDIPSDEIEQLKAMMRTGDVFTSVTDDFGDTQTARTPGNLDDRSYTVEKGIEKIVNQYPGADKTVLQGLVDGYGRADNLAAKAIKIILNNDLDRKDDELFPLFTHSSTSYPTHPAVAQIRDLKYDAKSGAVGKGEVLASLLYGAAPPNPGQEVDISLTSGPAPGSWHVKYTNTPTGSTPWGESDAAKTAFWGAIDNPPEGEWTADEKKKFSDAVRGNEPKYQSGGFSAAQAGRALSEAGLDPSDRKYADAIDYAMTQMARSGVPGGTAEGVLYATANGFMFKPWTSVKFGGIMKSGRITVAHEQSTDFYDRMSTSSASASARGDREQAAWDGINVGGSPRYDLIPNLAVLKDVLRYRKIEQVGDISVSQIRKGDVSAAIELLKKEDEKELDGSAGPSTQPEESRARSGPLLNEQLLELRVSLLVEELTRSDKKAVERMIAKQIHADRSEQKKLAQKQFETELKKVLGKDLMGGPAKINRAIQEIAKEQLKNELKGDKLKNAMADVTKLVLKKLYRELAYSYTPVIDRIKV